MSPLTLFLIVAVVLVVIAVLNWKARLKDAREVKEEQAQEAAARQKRLGPDFKSGSGTPEPEINLYEPPSDYLAEPIDGTFSTEQVEAALEQQDQRLLNSLPIGASRFGSVPDLPPSISWPLFEGKKLPFLAQIDLSVLPKSLLPSEGWLYAFGLCDNDHDGTPVKVFHYHGPRTELIRATKPAANELWPDWDTQTVYTTVPLQTTPANGWKEVGGTLFGNFAEDDGGAAAIAEAAERTGDDWITLLGISSTGSMLWSDCGWFHIVIRRQDLMKHDFSNACAALSLEG